MKLKRVITEISLALTLLALLAQALGQAPFIPPEIILYTDRQAYKAGQDVAILGLVVDENFNPVPDITVAIIVYDPENTPVLDTEVTTNQSGVFTAALKIGEDSPEGEYLITASDLEGEFSPGLRSFIVCNLCITEPQVVIVTTTLPGPTITTSITTTAQTTITTTATAQTTIMVETPATSDILTIIFIAMVAALFVVIFIAARRYG